MKIEKTSIFFMVLLILASLSGTVTAASSNNSTIIYDEDDAKDRINYLESQIESLIYQEEDINFKIIANNKDIEDANTRIKLYAKDIAQYHYALANCEMTEETRKITEDLLKNRYNRKYTDMTKVKNLTIENQKLRSHQNAIRELRGSYELEMEDLKLKWGILDQAP